MRAQLILPALAAVGLASCAQPATPTEPAPVEPELKTYDVPHDYGEEVWSLLSRTLGGKEPTGRVALGPGNKLVVVAPPGVQAGVGAFMRELQAMDTPPASAVPVTMTYWVVAGQPSEETRVPADLTEVKEALDHVAGTQGPMEFALLERVQLTSRERTAHARGVVTEIEQDATTVRDEIIADVELSAGRHYLNTQIKTKPGKLVVLGQTGLDPRRLENETAEHRLPGDSDYLTLFWVLRADSAQ